MSTQFVHESSASVSVRYKNRTTIATVTYPDGLSFTGKARCNRVDRFSKEIGAGIAIARALKKRIVYFEDLFKSYAVSNTWYLDRHPNKR